MKVIKRLIICSILVFVLTACGILGFYAHENSINIGDWLHGQQNVTNQEYVDLKQEYENRIQEFLNEISSLENENQNLNKQLKTEQDNVSNLTTQIAELEKENSENTTKIEEYETQISQLNSQISNLENEAESNSQEISNLERQRQELSARISQLEEEAETNAEEIARLQKQEQDLSAQITRLESNVQSKETEIADLEHDKQELTKQKTELEEQVGQKTETISDLQQEIETKNDRIKELEQSLSQNNAEIESLNATIQDLQEQLKNQLTNAFNTIRTFADNSPETISAVSTLISACNMSSEEIATIFGWHIGDKINISVGQETVTIRILGFCHDDLSDGSGKAGISLGMVDCLSSKYQMTDTYNNGWEKSIMNTETMNTLFNELPAGWQKIIKSVNKKATVGRNSNEITTSSDKLWPLAVAEIFPEESFNSRLSVDIGKNPSLYLSEGTQYEYYKDLLKDYINSNYGNPELVKKLSNGTGSAISYWLRTSSHTSSSFNVIDNNPVFLAELYSESAVFLIIPFFVENNRYFPSAKF